MVFATKDINGVYQSLQNHGFPLGEPADGEGTLCGVIIESNKENYLAHSIMPIRVGGKIGI